MKSDTSWIVKDEEWNQAWMEVNQSPNNRSTGTSQSEDTAGAAKSRYENVVSLLDPDVTPSNKSRPTITNISSGDTFDTISSNLSSSSQQGYRTKFGKKRRPTAATISPTKTVSSLRVTTPFHYNNKITSQSHDTNDDSTTTSTTSTGSYPVASASKRKYSITTSNKDDRNDTTRSHASIESRPVRSKAPLSNNQSSNTEYEDEVDRVVQHLIRRCNITVVENPNTTPFEVLSKTTIDNKKNKEKVEDCNEDVSLSSVSSLSISRTVSIPTITNVPPKIRKNNIQSNSNNNKSSRVTKLKKSVSFHRYDTIIYPQQQQQQSHSKNRQSSNKQESCGSSVGSNNCRVEYVYSLYSNEIEQEKRDHDVVDDIETVVSDFGYFFKCLHEGIKNDILQSPSTARSTNNKYPQQYRSSPNRSSSSHDRWSTTTSSVSTHSNYNRASTNNSNNKYYR